MNYTLINIISFFQEITKERQVVSTKVCLLLFVLICSGCSSNETLHKDLSVPKEIEKLQVNKNQLVLNPTEGKWYFNNRPFNGLAVSCHDNGVLAETIAYYKGKKDGVAKQWFANAALKKEAFYIENQLEGVVKSWWPNLKLASESHYVNGIREGVQKRWYSNGQMSRKNNLKNGLEDGLQQAWLENGKIYVNYEAKNGRIFGLKKANLCYELKNEKVQY